MTPKDRGNETRKQPFFWADNEVYDALASQVGIHAFAVYMAFCRYANNDTRECWPSQRTIALHLSTSLATVKRAVARLELAKLISIKRDGEGCKVTNVYTLLDVRDFAMGSNSTHSEVSDRDSEWALTDTRIVSDRHPNKTKEQDSKNKTQGSLLKVGSLAEESLGYFNEFYVQYPKRVGRELAKKAFVKAVSRLMSGADDGKKRAFYDAIDLLKSANVAFAYVQRSDEDKKFIPHPATWLNQARYLDDVSSETRVGGDDCENNGYRKSRSIADRIAEQLRD